MSQGNRRRLDLPRLERNYKIRIASTMMMILHSCTSGDEQETQSLYLARLEGPSSGVL
jgi:hypothetical protein